MPRRLAAIRECALYWRSEQSRAIDRGDAMRAAHAEKCALRFEAHLQREEPAPAQPSARRPEPPVTRVNPVSAALDKKIAATEIPPARSKEHGA